MNHSQAQTRMMDALDGALAANERAALDKHLAECTQCRSLWEGMARVDRLLATAEDFSAPLGFSRRVVARLDEPLPSEEWQLPPLGREDWVRTLIGIGVLALGGVTLAAWLLFPWLSAALGIARTTLMPGEWPSLVVEVQNWLTLLLSLGRVLLQLLGAANDFLSTNPILVVGVLGLLGVVAVWTWMLQQVTSGKTRGNVAMLF